MPITVTWNDPEQTVTRLDFNGAFTMDDLIDAWQAEVELQRSVTHPVYSLNTMNSIGPVIPGMTIPKIVGFVRQNRPPNLKMTVQVAYSYPVRRGLHIISSQFAHPYHIVPTFDEAYRLIAADRRQRLQTAS